MLVTKQLNAEEEWMCRISHSRYVHIHTAYLFVHTMKRTNNRNCFTLPENVKHNFNVFFHFRFFIWLSLFAAAATVAAISSSSSCFIYLFFFCLNSFTHTREISSSCFVCICLLQLFFVFSDFQFTTSQRSKTLVQTKRKKNVWLYFFIINEHRAFIQNGIVIYCVYVVVLRMCPNERFLSKKFHNRIGARFFSTTHNIMLSHFFSASGFSSPCIFDSDNFHWIFFCCWYRYWLLPVA